jgi:hypothetical protein
LKYDELHNSYPSTHSFEIQIKYDEFHEQVASTEDMKTAYKVSGVNDEAEKKKNLLDLHVDESIILRRILKEIEWVWTGLICCGTETSGRRALVKTVLNLWVPQNGGKLRDRSSDTLEC